MNVSIPFYSHAYIFGITLFIVYCKEFPLPFKSRNLTSVTSWDLSSLTRPCWDFYYHFPIHKYLLLIGILWMFMFCLYEYIYFWHILVSSALQEIPFSFHLLNARIKSVEFWLVFNLQNVKPQNPEQWWKFHVGYYISSCSQSINMVFVRHNFMLAILKWIFIHRYI